MDSNDRDPTLAGSEITVRKLLEYSKDGIAICDEAGTVIEWNPAMEQISGIPRSAAVGRPVWDVQYDSLPADKKGAGARESIRESFRQMIAGGTPVPPDKNLVTEIERPDMTRRTIETLNFFLPSGEGRMVASIVRDLTESNRSALALEEANRKLNLMSSITRHDINNQLTILNGYLSLLEAGGPGMERSEIFSSIKTSSSRIQRILAFTKEYQNVGVKNPVWQDLVTTIAAAQMPFEKGGIRITHDPHCTDVELYADPLLVRVFYNLIDNTLRHGKNVTQITFRCSLKDGNFVIVYEDDGVGIPEEIRPALFVRGKGKNTGYGLFLIREILAITRFTIEETGSEGNGVRFEITVPKGSFRRAEPGTKPPA